MAGGSMADGDDICFELERFIAGHAMIVWIGDHGSKTALGQTEARLSVPGNFHSDPLSIHNLCGQIILQTGVESQKSITSMHIVMKVSMVLLLLVLFSLYIGEIDRDIMK